MYNQKAVIEKVKNGFIIYYGNEWEPGEIESNLDKVLVKVKKYFLLPPVENQEEQEEE